ncbi:DegT/DnrJ/EryC1/StrS family aminotransferase [Pirellulaceae bacterium SH449]
MIPFLDLEAQTDELRQELDEAYHRFMNSGQYVLGQEVSEFESEYASFCEAEHCVGVGNGLDAIHLALRALNIGPGDEVIVPSNTYIATWLAVTQVGATIVPVEPDERTYNIDPNLISKALTKNTKAIIPVNLYGQPVDYDPILAIAKDANARVVIDNAQAQGAKYRGRKAGGIADIECHSFYPSKNLGAYGEAGAITTNDFSIAARIKLLRNYGSKIRYFNEECGFNSRIDALQAAFLRVKLKRLDEWNERRKSIASVYLREFASLTKTCPPFILPFVPEWADPVWHLFVIRHPQRGWLQDELNQRGIGTLIHYPVAVHKSDAYSAFRGFDLPLATQLAEQVLSLPIGPHLPPESVKTVIEAFKEISAADPCPSPTI